jgi:hypothetical protein
MRIPSWRNDVRPGSLDWSDLLVHLHLKLPEIRIGFRRDDAREVPLLLDHILAGAREHGLER